MNKFLGRIFGEADIEIQLDEVSGRKQSFYKDPVSGSPVYLPTFHDKETISGKISVNLNKSRSLDHNGIKIELIGTIETVTDKKNTSNFIILTKDLDIEGVIQNELTNYSFNFHNVEMQYESYRGEVTISRKYNQVNKEIEFLVFNPIHPDELAKNIEPFKSEVGIEEWLHLILDFHKNRYHLRDVVEGYVTFKKVSIRLVSMELHIVRKETVGQAPNANVESTVLTKFEIMDGGPIKSINYTKLDEIIPINFFLAPYNLTPTYSNINKRYSVQYFLSLVLTDAEERKYFKQHEIFLVRLENQEVKI